MTFCQDIQPPSVQCPPDMDVPTEAGQSYAAVSWQVPVSTDNSNTPLNITGLHPPLHLNVGHTEIRYEVTDSAGLRGSCTFSIHVKGETQNLNNDDDDYDDGGDDHDDGQTCRDKE